MSLLCLATHTTEHYISLLAPLSSTTATAATTAAPSYTKGSNEELLLQFASYAATSNTDGNKSFFSYFFPLNMFTDYCHHITNDCYDYYYHYHYCYYCFSIASKQSVSGYLNDFYLVFAGVEVVALAQALAMDLQLVKVNSRNNTHHQTS